MHGKPTYVSLVQPAMIHGSSNGGCRSITQKAIWTSSSISSSRAERSFLSLQLASLHGMQLTDCIKLVCCTWYADPFLSYFLRTGADRSTLQEHGRASQGNAKLPWYSHCSKPISSTSIKPAKTAQTSSVLRVTKLEAIPGILQQGTPSSSY